MKKIIFYIFIVLLVLPTLQRHFHIIELTKLNGSIKPAKNPTLSTEFWFNGEFQAKKERYIKENIGFRPSFIRLYNQMLFSCFHEANNPGGVIGKKDFLYLDSYIHNHTGENYVGDKRIKKVSQQLKYLQDYFNGKGVKLLTVFVPSKASFYAEHIPSRFKEFPINNFKAYCNAFDSLQVDYIDLEPYMLSKKEDSPYPMFSRNGLHWTTYGMAVGMKHVLSEIEKKYRLDLNEFSWEEPIPLNDVNIEEDHDAENLMNLYSDLPRESMPYPKFSFSSDSTKDKPKTLVISDSYYWRPYNAHLPHELFSWGGFWYYFNTARWMENGKGKKESVKNMDFESILLDQDIIILFASQATLHIFPYKFDEKAYPKFMPRDEKSLVEYYTEMIHKDANWKAQIEQKAVEENNPLDEQIRRNALWLAKKFIRENPDKDIAIQAIIDKIQKDKKWMKSIEKKAIKHNISTEEMLKKDAAWIYKQENK